MDRAANKRRFLLVKREGDMSELRADGRGGFTRVRKGDDDETEKAKKKPPFEGAKPPFGKPPAGNDKPDDDDEDEEKRKRAAEEEEEEEKRKKAAAAADEEKRTAKVTGADVVAKLAEIVGDLQDVAQKMDEEDDDEPSDVHMKKILAAHRKLGGISDAYMKRTAAKAVGVAKVGRKMSAARLAMYKEALETLQSLLSELMDSPKKDKDHQPDPGDPQVPPPGWNAKNPSQAPGNAKGAAAIKSAVEKGLGELVSLFKDQQAKIARLEKGVLPSNALAVDGVKKGRGDEVVWPVDMNARPRDSKDVSFLDP